MVNNYRQAYQKLKIRQLETLILNLKSFPESEPLWFVKMIEKYIVNFAKQTIFEFNDIFSVILE